MWGGEAKALRLDDGSEHISQKFRRRLMIMELNCSLSSPTSPHKMRIWNDSIVQFGKSRLNLMIFESVARA